MRTVFLSKYAAVASADSPLPIRNSPEGMSTSFMPIELVGLARLPDVLGPAS